MQCACGALPAQSHLSLLLHQQPLPDGSMNQMMKDSEFEGRVDALHWMLGFAGEQAEVVGGKRVVEIGSGYGAGAIACVRSGVDQYLGIEPEPFGVGVIQRDGIDPGYRVCFERAARNVERRRMLFLEGFADDWPEGDFDVCLIADVLEHVEDLSSITESAHRLLKPGGIVIASTCPLYFSAQGHHMFELLYDQPWGHLYEGFDVKRDIEPHTSTYLLSEFKTLNGVTHEEILATFQNSGFEISKQRTLPHEGADFSKVRNRIKSEYLERISEDVFNQSVSQIIAVKPAS